MSICTRFGTGTAWALLSGFLAHAYCDAAYAQGTTPDLRGESLQVQESWAACVDQTRPPAKRVSLCTRVIRALATERVEHPIDPLDAGSKERAVLLNKNLAQAYDDRANALNVSGKRDEAIADFTQAIALDQADLRAFSGRSYLYLESNRLALAIADLTRVVSAEPANGMAFYNRGVAHERNRELDQALDDYRNAVRLLPAFAPAHAALGRVLKPNDPNKALSELNAAMRLDAQSPALRTRATLDASLNRPEQALRDLNQIIARNGSDSVAYLDRGVANEQLGNLEAAIADYSRSVALAPSAAGYFNRAGVYERLQESEKALADFTAALAVDPRYAPALLARADVNYARSQLAASLDDYTRAIEVTPNDAAAHFKRGNVLFDLRRFAAAFSDYSASLKLEPDQPEVLYGRALAAERLGRLKDAEDDRRRALALDASGARTE